MRAQRPIGRRSLREVGDALAASGRAKAGEGLAAQLDPWVVWNGYPDALLFPNHLLAQGFYLLRARTQLREITNILLK
eukprot:gene4887-6236_t